ncbi:Protein tweety homolog 2 [Apodemus speciosus]|uniref:Protein tweety homolog n=1 Tax=Apodemus speciosus TaxID=105296 RepID=A0ABQ0FCQ6_APOSI
MWLSYLLLFILDLVICLVTCLGLARRSKCLLASMLCCGILTLVLSWASLAADAAAAVGTSDFCMAPDIYILNNTRSQISSGDPILPPLQSEPNQPLPAESLTIFQRSLTTMQIQVVGLLQFAVPLFPTAEKDLLGIQLLLNNSETSLHQLTAMLDCRGLHKDYLDALTGICYDGIEGLLFLGLFSLLAALAFSTLTCAGPRAWKHFINRDRDYDDIDDDDPFNPQARRIAAHNPTRGQLHSFCSYSSGLGSQCSLQPPAQTISNAPVSENQAVLFGGNPRYENVPLIGRGSPPPTPWLSWNSLWPRTQKSACLCLPSAGIKGVRHHRPATDFIINPSQTGFGKICCCEKEKNHFAVAYSPSMRATYMSVADEHLRHYEFPS